MKIYLFFREGGFYPIALPDRDDQIIDHVLANPETIRVEDLNGNIIWKEDTK